MGISKSKAVQNRQAIVDAASRLFRERGVDGVGLNEIMKEAGFTQGGFYNHFKSKGALVAEVVDQTMAKKQAELKQSIARSITAGRDPLLHEIDRFLSPAHRDNVCAGCAVTGFAGDAPRLGKDAQDQYAIGLRSALATYAKLLCERLHLTVNSRALRSRTMVFYSQMVGALLLSRTVMETDRAMADEILKRVRTELRKELGAQ